MSKKLLAFGLAVMMLFTCIIPGAVSASTPATTLSSVHSFGAAPEGWVDVADDNFEMLKYYSGDGAGNWTEVTENLKNELQGNSGAAAHNWQYFDGGHLRDGSAYNTTNCFGAVEFTFTGTAVAWIAQFRHMAGSVNGPQSAITVYIDGVKVEDLAANPSAAFDGDHIKPTIMYQKDGLSKAEHTLRLESATQGYFTVDSFSYMPCEAEPEVEPLKVVSAYRINGNDNDLYVVFNKKVAAPAAGNDLVLALVANGWAGAPSGWDAANTAIARVAFPFAEAVSDQVFKFTRAGHVSWACDGGNINGEHPAVVAPVGGFWFWALLGNTTVTTADGAETLAQDYADVWNVYGKEIGRAHV